jgi:hypothetical protein
MEFHLATYPGRAEKANEDFAAATAEAAVLLDGAGIPEEFDKGCRHGVAWFTRTVGALVLAEATAGRALADAVAGAIRTTAGLHADTCDLDNPNTPSATLVAVRFTPHQVDYLVLGDSTLVLDSGAEEPRAITDERFAEVSRRVVAEGAATRHQRHQARAALHNTPGGYWTVSADPRAAHEAVTGSVPRTELAGLALLSDGATRLVDVFARETWRSTLDLLRDKGPAALLDQVRDAEYADPDRSRWPRSKTHDDATAVYWHSTD